MEICGQEESIRVFLCEYTNSTNHNRILPKITDVHNKVSCKSVFQLWENVYGKCLPARINQLLKFQAVVVKCAM